MKKPSWRTHLRRICSASGSGSAIRARHPLPGRGRGRLPRRRRVPTSGAFPWRRLPREPRASEDLRSQDARGLWRFALRCPPGAWRGWGAERRRLAEGGRAGGRGLRGRTGPHAAVGPGAPGAVPGPARRAHRPTGAGGRGRGDGREREARAGTARPALK